MKFYYYTKTSNVISLLGKGKKIPNRAGYVEITEEQYNAYIDTLNSIEDRSGYTKKVTLYIDGTYDVEYVPVVEIEE